MRKKEELEDIIHKLITRMLPRMSKDNIRPSYQNKGGYAGKNEINDKYEDGISGFSNDDIFIYFTVKPDEDTQLPFINEDGTISITRINEVTFSIYGAEGGNIALAIYSMFHSHFILQELALHDLYLYGDNTNIRSTFEEINGEMWERRDFVKHLNECIIIAAPKDEFTKLAEKADGTVIIDGIEYATFAVDAVKSSTTGD